MKSTLPPWLVILIVALAVSLFGYFGFSRNNSRPTATPSVPAASSSLEDEKSSFLKRSQINFPSVSSSSAATTDELSADLKIFLLREGMNQRIKKLNYTDGRNGFQIDYTLILPLFDSHSQFGLVLRQNKSWQGIFGIRGNLFALTEVENQSYQAGIQQNAISANQTSISIKAISK